MNNVATINRKTMIPSYTNWRKTEGLLDPVVFFGGVFLSLVLPKLVYVDSGGPVSLTAFAVLATAGVVLGLINYRYPEPGPPSIIGPGSAKQSPNTYEPMQRKAA